MISNMLFPYNKLRLKGEKVVSIFLSYVDINTSFKEFIKIVF